MLTKNHTYHTRPYSGVGFQVVNNVCNYTSSIHESYTELHFSGAKVKQFRLSRRFIGCFGVLRFLPFFRYFFIFVVFWG